MNDSSGKTNKVALVTGAADRLGAVLARTLHQNGYKVVIHCNSSTEKADKLAAELGAGAAVTQANLTERKDRATLIAKAAEHFGPLTVLVNNASIYNLDSIETLAEDYWDTHFAIHAETPVFLSRDFARALPDGQHGCIVNIIDERVLHPNPAAFSYYLSKSVLWTATQTMAQSLAPSIRVNAIGPGPILPEVGQSDDDFDDQASDRLLNRNADPAGIADALMYLINAQAVTGQFMAVDGGDHLAWSPLRDKTPRQS